MLYTYTRKYYPQKTCYNGFVFFSFSRYAHHLHQQQYNQQHCRPVAVHNHPHMMGGAAPPPTYEEHVMHYTMLDSRHHYTHYPAALYEEYDPDGKPKHHFLSFHFQSIPIMFYLKIYFSFVFGKCCFTRNPETNLMLQKSNKRIRRKVIFAT